MRSADERDGRVSRIAGGLSQLGIRAGDSVALLMRNDIAFLEASYAVMRLGAYAVPINWHFKGPEIAYILEDSLCRALIGHADLIAVVQDAIPAGTKIFALSPPPEIVAVYEIAPASCAIPEDAADFEAWLTSAPPYAGANVPPTQSMIYTSGTTGHPKGVRREAPNAEQQVAQDEHRARYYGVKPGIRALLPGPLYHSAPNTFGLRAGMVADVLILMPRFDPEALLALIEAERIDTIFMVPTMFVRLLALPEETRRRYDLSSLRHVVHAAAPCPAHVKAAMIAWWGPVICEFYGSTETGGVTFATSEEALKKPGTVGRAAPGARVVIRGENGEPAAPGIVGEIYSAFSYYPEFTYHNRAEKRAEIGWNGLITCGDIGYLDAEGYLFICDRKADMVISGGVNIYPAEIEAALLALPGVSDCAVFGIPDETFGESLMAVVEPQGGVTLDPEALRLALKTQLSDYKLPRRIEIRSDLPREDSGKIFKRRLRDPYWANTGRKI
jgi:long-chain acyl-CoA synthetase